MTLAFPVAPMKATLGSLPADDDRWGYEIKWDGYRTLVFIDGPTLRLQSSSGLDVSPRWPEIGPLVESVNAQRLILDGELVVLDDAGRPRFELLQRSARPAVFQAFDVLQIGAHDTIGLAYTDRRRLLTEVVEPGSNWSVPSYRIGGGAELAAATAVEGLEGIMAKRIDSVYRPGVRSNDWRKIKNRRRLDLVVGGFTAGTGNRSSSFGSLLVGRHDGDRLVFAGGVGTGFDQRTLDRLRARLDELADAACPFDPPPPAAHRRTATWVRPELVATIEFTELTNDGAVRHASFCGLADGT
jgi:bifunctional non-homologous end joining protein LigD